MNCQLKKNMNPRFSFAYFINKRNTGATWIEPVFNKDWHQRALWNKNKSYLLLQPWDFIPSLSISLPLDVVGAGGAHSMMHLNP